MQICIVIITLIPLHP